MVKVCPSTEEVYEHCIFKSISIWQTDTVQLLTTLLGQYVRQNPPWEHLAVCGSLLCSLVAPPALRCPPGCPP